MTSARVLLLSMATSALSAVHVVMVGDGGLNFVPNSLTAAVGDQIEYQFVAAGHNVVEGSFSSPCQPLSSSAFYSGPDVTKGGPPFVVTINSTDPIWYYCATPSHCQNGMVGVINPPSGETEAMYASAASNTDNSNAPDNVQGGVFGLMAAASMSSSMMSTSMMSTSMMSTSMMASSSSMAVAPVQTLASTMTTDMSSMMSTAAMASSSMTSSAMASAYSGAAADYKPNGVGLAMGVLGIMAAL